MFHPNRFARVVALTAVTAGLMIPVGMAHARSVESLSTGVGVQERVAHQGYSLLLTFAEAQGPYVANVAVEIKDADRNVVLTTMSSGPWLFAKLPPGDYTVVATRSTGAVTGAAFTIGGSGQLTVRLTW
jgi:hypothetical protein